MAVTKAFMNAVAKHDIQKIRIMMKDSLLVDPTFRDFDKMSKLAANVPGLYDVHNGKNLLSDVTAWNDEYMDKQMVEVLWNFSHKRLDHLKQVVRALRPTPGQFSSFQNRVEFENHKKYIQNLNRIYAVTVSTFSFYSRFIKLYEQALILVDKVIN